MRSFLLIISLLTNTCLCAQSSDSVDAIASELLTRRYVKYPGPAEEVGIEGTVLVEFTLDRRCRIQNKRVVRGLGYGLDEAALGIIDKKFQDALTGALAPCTPDTLIVPVRFQLP